MYAKHRVEKAKLYFYCCFLTIAVRYREYSEREELFRGRNTWKMILYVTCDIY